MWVVERALSARSVSRALVATDDARIFDCVTSAGFEAAITRERHATGTDRIAEVARDLDAEIIVNVQGDEPLIDPLTIDRAVSALIDDRDAEIATTCEPIDEIADVLSRAVVKVVIDDNGHALEFSRGPIPFPNQAVLRHGSIEAALRNPDSSGLLSTFRKHTGLYVYRREFLVKFASWPQTESEAAESLEQLRALERGVKIRVVEASAPSIGVDTREDLERVRALIESKAKVAV